MAFDLIFSLGSTMFLSQLTAIFYPDIIYISVDDTTIKKQPI